MKYTKLLFSAFVTLTAFTSVGLADSFSFSLLPAGGSVTGPAGSTVGWGYSITNLSGADWLLTSGLESDSFVYGTPNLLFDFPVIAPGATVSEAFDAASSTGLYELSWDQTALNDYTNYGLFTLSAQWWDGDPFNGGGFVALPADTSAGYSATVSDSPASTPEPRTLWLGLPVLAFFLHRSKRPRRAIASVPGIHQASGIEKRE